MSWSRAPKNPKQKVCLHCSNTFAPPANRRGKAQYCGIPCYHAANKNTPEKRAACFWAKVDKRGPAECWPWTGAKQKWGHGFGHGVMAFSVSPGKNKQVLAHRMCWEIHHGPIPEGMCVLHNCDNPVCVNVAHLRLGTWDENIAEMRAKGRHAKGEQSNRHKLTAAQVIEIRREFVLGQKRIKGSGNADALAAKYGVDSGTIYQAATGRTLEAPAACRRVTSRRRRHMSNGQVTYYPMCAYCKERHDIDRICQAMFFAHAKAIKTIAEAQADASRPAAGDTGSTKE